MKNVVAAAKKIMAINLLRNCRGLVGGKLVIDLIDNANERRLLMSWLSCCHC